MKAYTVGERIKQKRLELGMSQSELAKKVGLTSDSSICKVEANERGIPMNKLQLYADALHVTVGYLIKPMEDTEDVVHDIVSHPDKYPKKSEAINEAIDEMLSSPVVCDEKNEKEFGKGLTGTINGLFAVLTNAEKKLVVEFATEVYRRSHEKKD